MKIQMIQKILNRDFVLAFFAQFTFISVFSILIPTLPIYLLRSGSKEAEIGVLIGIFFVSSLVLRPFVGKALLKIPEKNFMITGTILFAITSIAYLLASPFWPLLIVRLFQGIGFAFFHTASFTLIANISSKTHRGQSLSYFYLANNLSGALGPSLGMFLINDFSFSFLFLVCLGLSLCSLFITYKLGRRQVVQLQAESSSTIYHWFLFPLYLGSFSCLFPSLCNKSWGGQSRTFLYYYCNYAYFGSCFGWEDIRSL
jgi:MFS family permease